MQIQLPEGFDGDQGLEGLGFVPVIDQFSAVEGCLFDHQSLGAG